MKIGLLTLPLLAALNTAYAQSRADMKTAERMKKDVAWLSSNRQADCFTGSESEHKVAEYIIKRYEDEDVAPYKGHYQHSFHFAHGKGIAKATQIKIGNNELRIKEDAFPLPYSKNTQASGNILPDVLESDNVWMVNLYIDKEEAEDPNFNWEKSMHDRAKEAEKQGATAILFYDGYGAVKPPVYNPMSDYEMVDIPVAFIGHDAYEKYVYSQEDNYAGGIPVSLNVIIKKTERTGTNVAAYIDNHRKHTVVIGAHYDNAAHNTDDNAVGTAALLEMAGWIKHHKLRHYNYLFVNFSGKDLGLLGSENFIKEEKFDSTRIAYMINIDMAGDPSADSTLYVSGTATSPAWATLTAPHNNDDIKILTDGTVGRLSDHSSFYSQGIPVLCIHPGNTTNSPTAYDSSVKMVKYVYNIVKAMDDEPKPVFTAAN